MQDLLVSHKLHPTNTENCLNASQIELIQLLDMPHVAGPGFAALQQRRQHTSFVDRKLGPFPFHTKLLCEDVQMPGLLV